MPQPIELVKALWALNAVLVHARTMAFEKRPHETLAKVLDIAELLPTLLMRADASATAYREQLEDLILLDEEFRYALQRFDE